MPGMDSLPEALGKRLGTLPGPGAPRRARQERLDSAVLEPPTGGRALPTLEFERSRPGAGRLERYRPLLAQLRVPLGVYVATRLLYLLIALVDGAARGFSLSAEVTNWDGAWYVNLTHWGYPHVASHLQTTLGFLPLYPMLTWLGAKAAFISFTAAGLLISTIGGFVATVLVQQLARRWWDEAASRRAVLFFCLFPGSIVFSMDYSEGIMLPLALGCLLALEHRRWLLAGLLAGAATAVAPVALAIVPACAVAAINELRHRGWREGRRALVAPLLAPAGLAAFGLFLWSWTGTPLASYNAQRYGWNEKSSPLAIYNTIRHAIHELFSWQSFHHPGINLNYDSGALGAIFLIWALWLVARTRPRISPAAIAWTIWVAILTLTSWNTPPNPRMLICAFPALMVVAYRLRGVAFRRLIVASTTLLVVMSALTYVGSSLRP